MPDLPVPPASVIREIVQRAFEEDLPDITSEAIFEAGERGSAYFLVKEEGVLAGQPFARMAFELLEDEARYTQLVEDGAHVKPGDRVATVEASVRTLLSAERTALNLMQRASGIATATRRYVDAVAGTAAGIFDTRKTAPGLRALDKYAVVAGGGQNHRIGLHDMFLIKNNHVDRAGSVRAAIERVRSSGGPQKVMVEVRTLAELDEALSCDPDYVLLDNMDVPTMEAAVRRTGRRIPLEASGGITIETIRAVAETGVERISVGALTHSVEALDISMRVE
jgi:nicotinate-nucleotide pyrophosphorylase (carboxylating)